MALVMSNIQFLDTNKVKSPYLIKFYYSLVLFGVIHLLKGDYPCPNGMHVLYAVFLKRKHFEKFYHFKYTKNISIRKYT